jgi:hypothetical protein
MANKNKSFVSNTSLTLEQAREIAKGVNFETGEGMRTQFTSMEDMEHYFDALDMVEEADGV